MVKRTAPSRLRPFKWAAIFSFNNFKWLAIAILLVLTAILILYFYQGRWGLGKWVDSSERDVDTGAYINFQPGAGQWRVKQMIITFLAGGALAFAGVLLQKVSRNNLAEVSILGIGSINIMFIFGYVLLFRKDMFDGNLVTSFLPLVTIFASVLGTVIVWLISRSKRANRNTFVIVGIALQLLFEAISVAFINPTTLTNTESGKKIWGEIRSYSLGQINAKDTPYWLIIVAGVIIGLAVTGAMFLRRRIDIYETNPRLAVTLGIKIERLRFTIFVLVALLAGIEASILGAVALLGVVAPSIARLLFRNKFALLGPAAFLIGGMLVMLASFIEINVGTDVPTGILATAITAPYFIFMVIRRR